MLQRAEESLTATLGGLDDRRRSREHPQISRLDTVGSDAITDCSRLVYYLYANLISWEIIWYDLNEYLAKDEYARRWSHWSPQADKVLSQLEVSPWYALSLSQ